MNNKEKNVEAGAEAAIVGNTVLNAAAIDCIVKELNKLQKYRNGIKVSNLSENTGHLLFRDVIKTLKRLGGLSSKTMTTVGVDGKEIIIQPVIVNKSQF